VITPTSARIGYAGLTVCVAAVLLSLSPGAAAAPTRTQANAAKKAPAKVVKPGDPGSSQYQEDVPSAFGSVPATQVSPHPSGLSLPHAVATQLGNAGAAGRAAAAIAVAGSPQRGESGTPHSHRRSHSSASGAGGSGGGPNSSGAGRAPAGGAAALAQAGSGRGIVAAVADSLVGSNSGIGVLLPVVLGASLLLAALIAMRRRRRGN
jgi:hypothetical protein